MSAVPLQEIVKKLRAAAREIAPHKRPSFLCEELANRIEQHGIAPPDGWVLVPKEPTQGMINAAIKNGAETVFADIARYGAGPQFKSLSDFIHNATTEQKAEVYAKVLDGAIARQQKPDAEPVACSYPNCQVTSGCAGSCKTPQYIAHPPMNTAERDNLDRAVGLLQRVKKAQYKIAVIPDGVDDFLPILDLDMTPPKPCSPPLKLGEQSER